MDYKVPDLVDRELISSTENGLDCGDQLMSERSEGRAVEDRTDHQSTVW